MDDGSLGIFEGYRAEYNNALGPYKGGIRYHPNTEVNEVKALTEDWRKTKSWQPGWEYDII